jgi:hypothetical protein
MIREVFPVLGIAAFLDSAASPFCQLFSKKILCIFLRSSAWHRLLRESSQRRQPLNQSQGLLKDTKGSYSQLPSQFELKPFGCFGLVFGILWFERNLFFFALPREFS